MSLDNPRSGRWVDTFGVVFFLVALVGAFLLSGGTGEDEAESTVTELGTVTESGASDSASEGAQTATVSVAGEALQPQPEGVQVSDSSNDPMIGQLAPTISGTNFAGETVEIGPGGGPKAVFFLAHWCPHCQRELPAIVDLIDAGQLPPDVEVYAVSTAVDLSRGNPPSGWFANERWPTAVILDDQNNSAFAAYGGGGFPYAVYLDSDNRVLTRTAGELGPEAIEDLWLAIADS